MQLGLAALRIVVGGLLTGHGLQKLAGRFGGRGLRATGESFESMGLRPGRAHAALAGGGETAGGLLLAGGLLTPLGAALISGSMLTAIRKVHGPKGVWVADGGYEYNLVLLAALFALTDQGPGRLSLDEALGTRRAGLRWALAELAAGALGSTAALAYAEHRARRAQPSPPAAPRFAEDGAPREPQYAGHA
jgi:putative oxidoreductase